MVLKLDLGENEDKFRELAMKEYGYKKGALLKAAKNALGNWMRNRDKHEKIPKMSSNEAVKLLRGILKKYRGKTSVEIQHEYVEWGD
jgi:hypothetical protein